MRQLSFLSHAYFSPKLSIKHSSKKLRIVLANQIDDNLCSYFKKQYLNLFVTPFLKNVHGFDYFKPVCTEKCYTILYHMYHII